MSDIDKQQKDFESKDEDGYDWTYENGRRYPAAGLGHYFLPNDEPEVQRLNEQHMILTEVKDGRLHHTPLSKTAGLKILDIGCGTGIWCLQMAEAYPSSMLIAGMDVSPVQSTRKPANVEWITHDVESEWPFPDEYFDLVHLSLVHGSIADWNQMMAKIVKHLVPGGWIEHQEFSVCRQYLVDEQDRPIPLSDDWDDQEPPILRWQRLMEKGSLLRGRQLQLGPHLTTFQKNAGLQNVTEKVFSIKWGTWPSDPKERNLGARFMLTSMAGMEGFTLVMFTKALGWSFEDTQAFIAEIKQDIRDDSLRKVMDMHVVFSQKPGYSKQRSKQTHGAVLGPGYQYWQLGVGLVAGAALVSALSMWIVRRR